MNVCAAVVDGETIIVNVHPNNSGVLSGKTWTSNENFILEGHNLVITNSNDNWKYSDHNGVTVFATTCGSNRTVTITAPAGYVIGNYTVTAVANDRKVTIGNKTASSKGGSVTYTQTPNSPTASFKLSRDGGTPTVWFDNFVVTLKKQAFVATVNAVDAISGKTFGGGTQVATATSASTTFNFTLNAKSKEGYKFAGWSETAGGDVISNEANYVVPVTCNSTNPTIVRNVYANYAPEIVQNTSTYINPISDIDAADPSVILAQDGYYYMYCTERNAGEGMPVWRSSDMVNWTKITNIFAQHPANVTYTYLWAPEIAYVNGKYVLYYANADYGSQQNTQICVATSDKPYGPFENNKILLRAGDNNFGAVNVGVDNVIDPSLFRDDDGKNYLVWGSYKGIWYIELDENCTSVKAGASKKAIATHQDDYTLPIIGKVNANGDWDEIEAPMVVKHKAADTGKTYYYLICSEGRTVGSNNPAEITYKMVEARGESLGGDFYDIQGRKVFHQQVGLSELNGVEMNELLKTSYNDPAARALGPGHNSQFVKDFNGQEWVFYHGYARGNDGNWNISAGRRVFANMIEWDKKWSDDYEGIGWPGIVPPNDDPIEQPTVDPKGPDAYPIYDAQDLLDFAAAVNGGEVFATAMLMNDINMAGVTYTPIGTATNKFKGIIDGQGYRIKNLTINGGDDTGLVAYADGGAQFRYIIIDSSCEISGGTHTGAFLGRLDGSGVVQFYCCGNEAHVTGGQNTAGFVGCDTGVTLYFDNCYNTGYIEGDSESAAFSGWGVDRLRNCWNTGRTMGCEGAGDGKWYSLARDYNANKNVNSYDLNADNAPLSFDSAPAGYDNSWLSNGHITYYINQHAGEIVWYQNIDASFGDEKDPHPVFLASHLPVYNDGDDYYNVRVEAEYIRALNNSNYGTFCLGYETISTVGAKFYDILAVQKDGDEYKTIILQEVADQQHLVAGKAYIFKPEEGSTQLRCTYWDGARKDAIVAPGLVGNLIKNDFKVPVGDYILTGNKIKKVVGNNYINLNRAYITGFGKLHEDVEYSDPSKIVFFGFDGDIEEGEATEVEFVISDPEKNQNVLYNVAGQRISQPVRGQIYIMNGRKYIAR